MKRVIGIMILLCIVGCGSSRKISEEARRSHYLMPTVGTKAHIEWVAKYGDTADSWALFTVDFHTNYLKQLNAAILEIRASLIDPNEVVDPNETVVEAN